jgi:hypothetical protein
MKHLKEICVAIALAICWPLQSQAEIPSERLLFDELSVGVSELNAAALSMLSIYDNVAQPSYEQPCGAEIDCCSRVCGDPGLRFKLTFDRELIGSLDFETIIRGQGGEGSQGQGGGGDLSSQATNPTSDLTIYQIQNNFVPSTYEASGFAHILGLQAVKPFKTGNAFFPIWVTRTTLPVVTTADPDGEIPIGPGNGTEFSLPIDNQAGLGDLVFISILNHPTQWGSWGVGPGFVAPTATRLELGEQSWKFSPTFAVVHTAIPTWQLGILGFYNFPLDDDGTQALQFQPLIVKQLGGGWFTGWGDDLWSFNTETGNFDMPLQLRLGKVHKIGEHNYNIFVTGAYTPDELRKGPAPEWGIKLSISLLVPGS